MGFPIIIKTKWNRPFILSILALFLLIHFLPSCKQSGNNRDISSTISVENDSVLAALNLRIEAQPDNIDLYIERAKHYLNKKELNLALADAGRATLMDSTKADNFVVLADIYFARNEIAYSKSALEKCVALNPSQVDALTKLAELYLYLRKYSECIAYANLALGANPVNAKPHFIKGMAYKENGDTTRAILSMNTAVEIDPAYYHAQMQLGMLFAAKKNKLAEEYFRNAIRTDSISPEAWYALGMYYQETNQLNKAIQTYTTLSLITPRYRESYYNLGYIHYEYLKEYHQAIRHFDDAVKADTTFARAVYMRGLCFEALGDINRARIEYNYALKLDPALVGHSSFWASIEW